MFFLNCLLMGLASWEVSKILYPNVVQKARVEAQILKKEPILYLEKKPTSAVAVVPGQKVVMDGQVVMKADYSSQYMLSMIVSLVYVVILLATLITGFVYDNNIYLIGAVGIELCGSIINRADTTKKWVIRLDAVLSTIILINMVYLTM